MSAPESVSTLLLTLPSSEVIEACAAPRADDLGTWIIPEMIDAYSALHSLGQAHSVEVWDEDRLVGGIYGIAVGGVFCGESMFSLVPNGSKIAMAYLCHWIQSQGFELLDCQIENPHLISMGAILIPREEFLAQLAGCKDRVLGWPDGKGLGSLPIAGDFSLRSK